MPVIIYHLYSLVVACNRVVVVMYHRWMISMKCLVAPYFVDICNSCVPLLNNQNKRAGCSLKYKPSCVL